MNIKQWKRYSDLVDKNNEIDFYEIGAGDVVSLVAKTIENFYEWKAGKLKI